MSQDTIRAAVRERYGRIAEGVDDGCCVTSCCGGTGETVGTSHSTAVGYDDKELEQIPGGSRPGTGFRQPGGSRPTAGG